MLIPTAGEFILLIIPAKPKRAIKTKITKEKINTNFPILFECFLKYEGCSTYFFEISFRCFPSQSLYSFSPPI